MVIQTPRCPQYMSFCLSIHFFKVSLRHKLLVWRVSWYWIENVNLMIIEALSTRFWLVTWRSIMHECDYDHRCDQLGALTSQEWLVINQDSPQKPTSSLPRRTAEVIKKSVFLTFNIYWEGEIPLKQEMFNVLYQYSIICHIILYW